MKDDERSSVLRPPFSVYDFFGYLIPAFVLLGCIYIFEVAADRHFPMLRHPLKSILEELYPDEDTGYSKQILFFLGITLGAYVLGHIVSTISSMLLDRILVSKAHSYPSENLLMKKARPLRETVTQNIYRGVFAWANIVIWSAIISAAAEIPPYFSIQFGDFNVHANFELIETWVTVFFVLVIAPLAYYAAVNVNWPIAIFQNRRLILVSSQIYAFPYNAMWWVLNRFFDWDEPLHPSIRLQYQNAFNKTFARNPSDARTDIYWFTCFYLAERAPALNKVLQNWFHQYSFARNVSTAFYLAFLYVGTYTAYTRGSNATFTSSAGTCFFAVAACYFTFSFLLAIRYHYLYFSYYSKNLYRSFVYLHTRPIEQAERVNETA